MNQQHKEKYYRRGLLLGLTLAESFLLIVFILLLIFTTMLISKEKSIKTLTSTVEDLNNKITDYKLISQAIASQSNNPSKFEDDFKKLTIKLKELKSQDELKSKLVELTQSNKQSREFLDKMQKKFSDKMPEVNESNIIPILDSLLSSLDPGKTDTKGVSLTSLITEKDNKISNLYGQLKNLQLKVEKTKGLGKGASYPPCWAEETTGNPEYIFDVYITENGLLLKNTCPENRKVDFESLPVSDLKFDSNVSSLEFQKQSTPLFQYSAKNDCRFFVRLIDSSGNITKDFYKKNRDAVESLFYIKQVK